MATIGNQDVEAYNAATTRANGEAQSAYYNASARGADQAAALNEAKFAWQKTMDEAGLTGMYQGQWTQPAMSNFANLFGTWAAPTPGQETMAREQQTFQQGQALGSMYGQYYAPGTAPTAGLETQAAIRQAADLAAQQAGLTGYYQAPIQRDQYLSARSQQLGSMGWSPEAAMQTAQSEWGQGFPQAGVQVAGGLPQGIGQRQQTLAGQQQEWSQGFQQTQFQAQQAQLAQQNAQQYLQLLASLRGPADWAKYQQVLGSTPNGMRDLYAAAMGQYTPGGGATTGVQPQAANLNTMQQQIAGQGGTEVWGSGLGVGQQQPSPAQQQQATGNGTNMYGGQQQQYNLPAPNQVAPQSWNNFTPSQQQLMLGQWESQGYDKNDVTALYNQSLPKYAQNQASAGTFRLR